MVRKFILLAMVSSVTFVSACGGRDPEPVMVKRYNDEKKNCELLAYDMENIEFQIHQLLPKTDKLKQNVAYGVSGWFLLYVPWLLMDFKNAEATEYEALTQRHRYLGSLAKKKGCNIEVKEYPSLEEVKEEYSVYKRLQPDYRVDENSLDPEVLKKNEESALDKLKKSVDQNISEPIKELSGTATKETKELGETAKEAVEPTMEKTKQ